MTTNTPNTMNTCHAIQFNNQSTTRYQLFRATDGREHLHTAYDVTPDALLDHMMASEDVYSDWDGDRKCWRRCSTDAIVAHRGDTTADMGDYSIAIYTDEEAREDAIISKMLDY